MLGSKGLLTLVSWRPLHELVMKGSDEFGKEENLLFLISLLVQQYGRPFEICIPECREEIEKACAFIEQHYAERIYLDQICRRGRNFAVKALGARGFASVRKQTVYEKEVKQNGLEK